MAQQTVQISNVSSEPSREKLISVYRYQTCRVGAVVRALASHQYSPGLIPASVVGSRFALRVSPGYSGFPPSEKPTSPNSNVIRIVG